MLNNVVQVFVALQPFYRGFRATLVYSGDVVDLVSDQGEVIDDLLRGHAEFFHHAVPVHPRLGHGIDQGDVIADQLRHILVAGRHHHINALAGRFVGKGADHIVGLNARHCQQRQSHGLDDLVDGFDLAGEILRHGRPVSFVLFIQVMPEGLALGVEDHHHF